MVRLSAVAALAVASSVAYANNVAPPVPENAQIGLLNLDVTCQLLDALNYTFNAVFTATAPTFGGSGQEIYYTDVVGVITIPANIVDFAGIVAVTQASAQAEIKLRLTNASPESFDAYKGTITGIPIPSGGDAKIRIPPGSGTLPPIGPITLGQADVAHRIFLGDVDITVTLQDKNGTQVLIPIPVHCGKQDIDFVIASINVDSSSGPPFSPSVGYVADFPATPRLYESGSFRFPYACDFGPLGPQTVDLIIGGTISDYFSPGQQFYLDNADAFLYVPQALLDLAKSTFPNATTIVTTTSEFELQWENATPSSFNVAQAGSLVTNTDIQSVSSDGKSFIIPIPATGYLPNVGPFTAGADGTFAAIAVGNAKAGVSLQDANGKVLFSFDATCKPTAPLELIAVPITSQVPGNYTYGINMAKQPSSGASPTSSAAGFALPSLSLPFKA